MSRGLPPFLQADKGFELGEWTVDYLAQRDQPLTFIPEWDCSVPIEVRTSVEICDFDSLLGSANLDTRDRIALVIEAQSTTVTRSHVSEPVEIVGNGRFAASVRIDPAHHIGGEARFRRQLVLLERKSDGSLAARRPGSIIWEDKEPASLVLEADYPRFPTEQVDFARIHLPPQGLCVFRVDDDDLNANFAGVARLILNAAHPLVQTATSGEGGDRSEIALGLIQYEAASALIRTALENEDLQAGSTQFDDGTVGRTLLAVLGNAFPGRSVNDVRDLRAANPERFTAALQATFGPTGREPQ